MYVCVVKRTSSFSSVAFYISLTLVLDVVFYCVGFTLLNGYDLVDFSNYFGFLVLCYSVALSTIGGRTISLS